MQLVVGLIVRPHGIRGEVIVDVRTDEPDERFAAGSVFATDSASARSERSEPRSRERQADSASARSERSEPRSREPGADSARLTVVYAKPHAAAGPGRLIVAFEGVADRDAAEALRGTLLEVDSADVPATGDPDEFHDHQLIGLGAVTSEGEELGEVARIDHAPASDLLVLRRPDGRTTLVPFVKAIVPEVDLAGGRVVITPPPGLLDL